MVDNRVSKTGISVDEAIETPLTEERPTQELRRHVTADRVATAIVVGWSEPDSFETVEIDNAEGGSIATPDPYSPDNSRRRRSSSSL